MSNALRCPPRTGVPLRIRGRALSTPSKHRSDTVPQLPATDARDLPHPDLVAAIPRLRRYARVLTGDAARADDLVQDTLARAWEKRRLWRIGSDLRAWLFTIMHNVHVNQFSMRQREYAHSSLDADDDPEAGWEVSV